MALDRRWVLLGLGALAGCAGAPQALPDYIFSLTAWASGDRVDFLLLNVTDQPVSVINDIIKNLSFEIRDSEGAPLTDGFVGFVLFDLLEGDTPRIFDERARRLASRKALKASLSASELALRVEQSIRRRLDPAQRYRVTFQTQVRVRNRDAFTTATVRSRSVCDLSVQAGRSRIDCRSALFG